MRTPHNKILTREDEQKIVDLYQSGKTTGEIHNLFPQVKQRKSILDTLHRHKIIGRKKWQYSKVNHNAFAKIDSEAAAYFLGLMITDGWVQKDSNEIGIQLEAQDKYILEEFAKFLNLQTPLLETRGMWRLVTHSPFLKRDLAKYGVVSQKTFCTFLPYLSLDMMPHLLRGILDGDGCVHKAKTGATHIMFSGTYQLCAAIEQFLIDQLSVNQVKVRPVHTIYCVTWTDQDDVSKIKILLWTDCKYFLRRKHCPVSLK